MMETLSQTKSFSKPDLIELASLLKVLGEPNRLLLLEKIMAGVQCNCDLGASLSLAPNLVSHHLSILCESGLVDSKRDETDGRWIFYSINEDRFNELKDVLTRFLDISRVQPCRSCCGRKGSDA
jgi:ArsR family transcriptional regulator